jgi:Predicted flavoprotein involved in K+ transport
MHTDVLVIGGGQAGLAAAFFLSRLGIPYVVLDKGHEVGEVWKRRYDSLTLFTPRNYSELPGMRLAGNPDGFPVKDEIAAALKRYAEDHQLNIRLETEVLALRKVEGEFLAETNRGTFTARHVIVATGPFQVPWIPPMAKQLDPGVVQMHSARYRNPADLRPGTALVVGGGNSGAQIAVELAASHQVVLSAAHRMNFFPLTIAGKSAFWWFDVLGILNAPSGSRIGRKVRQRPDPVFGFELKRLLAARRIALKPKTVRAEGRTVHFEDGTTVEADNVVWATGFRFDYGWLQIPGALDEGGKPLHERGVSPVEGLYYVGLPWQTSRNSALIGGVGKDAEAIVRRIAASRAVRA